MKILLYTDPHWSTNSSIIRSRGKKYSTRLENLIDSINWVEDMSVMYDCDSIICLGDFFDKPTLTAEELTALKEIEWNNAIEHWFIVGNHDSNINDLSFASTFSLIRDNNKFKIVNEPYFIDNILLLPYITQDNRKPLSEYVNSKVEKQIILSHNDIAGIQYGQFKSTSGFTIDEILECSDLYINGHLHNSGFVDRGERILNLGNLTGQNFSEDAFNHRHYCAILDTNTLELTFIENPYAFNFYKVFINKKEDLGILDKLGPNAVVSIQANEELVEETKELIDKLDNIKVNRITTIFKNNISENVEISSLAVTDHLKQFSDYILENMDNTDILKEELSNILL